MKNIHKCYIEVKKEKLKKRQNELEHLYFHSHNTLSLPEGVHKFENTGSNRSREICDRNFHWRERQMNK